MKRALLIPYVFTTMNWAAIVGLVCYLRDRQDVWTRPSPGLGPHGTRPEQWA